MTVPSLSIVTWSSLEGELPFTVALVTLKAEASWVDWLTSRLMVLPFGIVTDRARAVVDPSTDTSLPVVSL